MARMLDDLPDPVPLLLLAGDAIAWRLTETLVVLGVLLVGMALGAVLLAVIWFCRVHRSPVAIWNYALNFIWHSKQLRSWLRPDKRGMRCPGCEYSEIVDPGGGPEDIVEV